MHKHSYGSNLVPGNTEINLKENGLPKNLAENCFVTQAAGIVQKFASA